MLFSFCSIVVWSCSNISKSATIFGVPCGCPRILVRFCTAVVRVLNSPRTSSISGANAIAGLHVASVDGNADQLAARDRFSHSGPDVRPVFLAEHQVI